MRVDISKGEDPILVFTDISKNEYVCWVDGHEYRFSRALCPFTLDAQHCADRALIVKHG